MRLKNKKTGEIVEYDIIEAGLKVNPVGGYIAADSLTEFCDEWEDAPEEPKKHYEILSMGAVMEREDAEDETFRNQGQKEIGNYFDTREEAELAVRKLKALKRLKDNGMKKYSFHREKGGIDLDFYTLTILAPRDKDSLELLFGGEE